MEALVTAVIDDDPPELVSPLPRLIGPHVPGPDGFCVACEETYSRFAAAPCQWARYESEDLEKAVVERLADVERMAEQHKPEGGMCSCVRPLPCTVTQVFEERRRQHLGELAQLAALVGPTTVLPMMTRVPDVDPTPQTHRSRWRCPLRRRRPANARTEVVA